jgi:hypothetical protein
MPFDELLKSVTGSEARRGETGKDPGRGYNGYE